MSVTWLIWQRGGRLLAKFLRPWQNMTAKKPNPKLSKNGCPLGPGLNRRYGPPWSDVKKAQFIGLWMSGATGSKIMDAMGLPYLAMVYCARARMKLPARPKRERSSLLIRLGTPERIESSARVVSSENEKRWREKHSKMPPSTFPKATAVRHVAVVEPAPTVAYRTRNCLSCSKPFLSDGPGNRMCVYCRGRTGGLFDG